MSSLERTKTEYNKLIKRFESFDSESWNSGSSAESSDMVCCPQVLFNTKSNPQSSPMPSAAIIPKTGTSLRRASSGAVLDRVTAEPSFVGSEESEKRDSFVTNGF